MLGKQRLLIALADGEHVRFVQLDADHIPKTVTIADAISAHRRSADLGTDRPGASFHSDATAHHSLSPRHDLKAAAKENFAAFVATQLNDAETSGVFEALLLVAPAHTLDVIHKELSPATASRVVASINKDLIKVPDHALAPHLSPWVRPKKRPLHDATR